MKIAFIGQKGIPARFGGVERHVYDLSTLLVKRGFDVTVYSRQWYSGHKKENIDGIKVKHLPSIKTKHLDTITHTFLATLHAIRGNFDVVHYHGVGPSLWAWLPRIFARGCSVVTTFHSIDRKHEKWGFFARLVLRFGEWSACRFSHQTITVSKTIRQYARDVYDVNAKYLPNSVNIKEPTKNTEQLNKFGLKPKKYILLVSRLIPHKGVHYLISAFNRVCAFYPNLVGETKLVLVGDGYYTNEYVESLKILSYGNPSVKFLGFQAGEDLHQLYSHAEIMVHPSEKEGLPLSVLEGMSYGLPVILSDIPEHIELVQNKEFIFGSGEIKSLTDRLKLVLEKDKTVLAEEGRRNKQKVLEEYTWEKVTDQIVELYEELKVSNESDKNFLVKTLKIS